MALQEIAQTERDAKTGTAEQDLILTLVGCHELNRVDFGTIIALPVHQLDADAQCAESHSQPPGSPTFQLSVPVGMGCT